MKTFYLPIVGLMACALGSVMCPGVGFAQSGNCGTRDRVLQTLGEKYGETRRGLGLAGPSGIAELYASTQTGSWTFTVTLPNGMTCLIASGSGWEAVQEEVPAKGTPS